MKKPDLLLSSSHGALAQDRQELFEGERDDVLPDDANAWLTFLWRRVGFAEWSTHAEPFYYDPVDLKANETRAIERVQAFRVDVLKGDAFEVQNVQIEKTNPFRHKSQATLTAEIRAAARKLRADRRLN